MMWRRAITAAMLIAAASIHAGCICNAIGCESSATLRLRGPGVLALGRYEVIVTREDGRQYPNDRRCGGSCRNASVLITSTKVSPPRNKTEADGELARARVYSATHADFELMVDPHGPNVSSSTSRISTKRAGETGGLVR